MAISFAHPAITLPNVAKVLDKYVIIGVRNFLFEAFLFHSHKQNSKRSHHVPDRSALGLFIKNNLTIQTARAILLTYSGSQPK